MAVLYFAPPRESDKDGSEDRHADAHGLEPEAAPRREPLGQNLLADGGGLEQRADPGVANSADARFSPLWSRHEMPDLHDSNCRHNVAV